MGDSKSWIFQPGVAMYNEGKSRCQRRSGCRRNTNSSANFPSTLKKNGRHAARTRRDHHGVGPAGCPFARGELVPFYKDTTD